MALAQRLNGAILGADSRQVYREFNIGTAKPSAQEQRLVPHYLIDICEPTDTLTVADYQSRAQKQICQLHAQGQQPLLVGGTGLYINAIAKGLKIPRVAPHQPLRRQLGDLGQPHCYQLLQQVDAAAAARIHPHDAVRTLRALEVYYATGIPISDQQGESPPAYPRLSIGLDCGAQLHQRITQRVHAMVETGLLAEVESLIQRYGAELPLLSTLGYAEMREVILGDCTLEEAVAATARHTRQFAKRQRTWFRKEAAMEWFDATAPDLTEQVWQRVQAWLQDQSAALNRHSRS